jgi:hypothetical protein
LEQWTVLIKDHHEGYITWERYMKNQEQLRANSTKAHAVHASAPRSGSAMLSGLLRCARCGLKLSVAYRSAHGRSGRYQCMTGTREQGRPVCQSFAAYRVDQAVEAELLKTCEPFAVEASMQAVSEKKSEVGQKRRMLEIAFEKARYEVDRARRQYDAVDPANRLVAAELEARWNMALTNAAAAEQRLKDAADEPAPLSAEQREKLLTLGTNLRLLWDDPAAPLELKKRILRTAIREVIVQINHASSRIELVIHWVGGVHTSLEVPKNRTGRNKNAATQETVDLVRELALGWPDKYIANLLNRIGSRTGPGNSWSQRLRNPDQQRAVRPEAPGERLDDAAHDLLAKVDQQVAAQHDVELPEGLHGSGVGHVQLAPGDRVPNPRMHDQRVAVGGDPARGIDACGDLAQ